MQKPTGKNVGHRINHAVGLLLLRGHELLKIGQPEPSNFEVTANKDQGSQHNCNHNDKQDLGRDAHLQAATIPELVGEEERQNPQDKDHRRKDDQNPEFLLLRFQLKEFRLDTRLRTDLFHILRISHALHAKSDRTKLRVKIPLDHYQLLITRI